MSKTVQTTPGKRYWQRSLQLVGACLLVWLLVTLLPIVLAQFRASGTIMGWPWVFALAAFAVPLAYLSIIGVYCLVMDRLERRQVSVHSGEESP